MAEVYVEIHDPISNEELTEMFNKELCNRIFIWIVLKGDWCNIKFENIL